MSYQAGDLVLWAYRYGKVKALIPCRIDSVSAQKYRVVYVDDSGNRKVTSVLKENIMRPLKVLDTMQLKSSDVQLLITE